MTLEMIWGLVKIFANTENMKVKYSFIMQKLTIFTAYFCGSSCCTPPYTHRLYKLIIILFFIPSNFSRSVNLNISSNNSSSFALRFELWDIVLLSTAVFQRHPSFCAFQLRYMQKLNSTIFNFLCYTYEICPLPWIYLPKLSPLLLYFESLASVYFLSFVYCVDQLVFRRFFVDQLAFICFFF